MALDFDEEYNVETIHTTPKTTRLLPSWSRQKPSRSFITTILYILSGFLVGSYWNQSFTSITSRNRTFNTVATVFEMNETFTQAPELGSDKAWSSLIPMGQGGYVAVDSREKVIPYSGQEVDLSDVRAVSVFHQIHCLNMLRVAYFANQQTNTTADANQNPIHNHESHTHTQVNTHDHDHASSSHLLHCFDYLRQALMCSADTSLEPLRSSTLTTNPGVDGWGVTHQCRDYGEVMEWATVHRTGGNGGVA